MGAALTRYRVEGEKMAAATICDKCQKVIEGEVKTELIADSASGRINVTLVDDDWCQTCANKAMAALCQKAWDSVKRKRAPK